MRILIIRVSSIGDVIHTIPAIFLIKYYQPEAQISWVVQRKVASLLDTMPFLENRWILNDSFLAPRNIAHTIKTVKSIKQFEWDAIIDFQGLLKTVPIVAPLTGKKFGFSWACVREGLSTLCTNHRTTPICRNIIQKNLALVDATLEFFNKKVCCPTLETLKSTIQLSFPQSTQTPVNSWLAANNIENFIILCPNTTWQSKEWPTEVWQECINKLKRAIPTYRIVLLGASHGHQAKDIATWAKNNCIALDVAPGWDLVSAAYCVSKAKLIVAPDTSFLHLADLLSVPAIGIFGPTCAKQHGPLLSALNQHNTFQIECPHRYKKLHKNNFWALKQQNCMFTLSPDIVVSRILNNIGL